MLFADQLRHAATALGLSPEDARVTRSDRPDLADFQSNIGFTGARVLRMAPATVAQMLAVQIDDPEVTVHVASGYVNFRFTDEALVSRLLPIVPRPKTGEVIWFDYGGPNIAKPMHVGHLRSLVLGSSLAAMASHMGSTVETDVHYGDWGYQMGLLLAYSEANTLDQLESDYVLASEKAKADPAFKQTAQKMTLALQQGDQAERLRWNDFVRLSKASVQSDLEALGVSFMHEFGESSANPYMDDLMRALDGVTRVSDGAVVAGDFDPPMILRNREGGYLYGATDLATLLLRQAVNPPDRVIYVVDLRQSLHFEQVFALADHVSTAKLEHVGFGTVNGPDGKPFRTREGGVPRLSMLIGEAVAKAAERIDDPSTARLVARAALKFADIQTKRTSNYAFDLDRALAMEGRTGVYMLYQGVRIRSILTKATVDPGPIEITTPLQRRLAREVLAFDDALDAAWEARQPHILADYLYELSQTFSSFYAAERVGDSPSNLSLAQLVQDRLDTGLRLLGIETVERM